MKFRGVFYNPEYDGEGLTAFEHDDGKVVLTFYSYSLHGNQVWLIGSGPRQGSSVVCNMVQTYGGKMGDKLALKGVVEMPWGQIRLTDVDGIVHATFIPNVGLPWFYPVGQIHNVPSAPVPVPVPTPQPPPALLPTGLTLRQKPGAGGAPWIITTGDRLISGGAEQIEKSRVGGVWFSIEVTVVTGSITINKMAVGGSYAPTITGIKNGDILKAGDAPRVIKFAMDKAGAVKPPGASGRPEASYMIYTKEHGLIIHIGTVIL